MSLDSSLKIQINPLAKNNLQINIERTNLKASLSLWDIFCVGMESLTTIAVNRPKAKIEDVTNLRPFIFMLKEEHDFDMFKDSPKGRTKIGILSLGVYSVCD